MIQNTLIVIMTKADIVYQTFKSPFALSLTDLYLYEGNMIMKDATNLIYTS